MDPGSVVRMSKAATLRNVMLAAIEWVAANAP